jgi:thiamine-monophosphate kinase
VPAGPRARGREGRDRGGRPLPRGRPAGAGRRQAAPGQPLRPRRDGGRAPGYLTALARPKSLDDQWLARFAAGLAADQARFGCHLLGGDTVSTPGPLLLSLTILGTVPEGRALLRSGARPGDQIWVSGTLGDAALGLRVLKGLALPDEEAMPLVDRYRTPRPRLELGRALLGLATAAVDVSDGLVADLGHIAETSRVAAVVDADALPLSEAGRGVPAAREAALTGGDDYELLFTALADAEARVEALSRELGLRLTRVGRIEARCGRTRARRRGRGGPGGEGGVEPLLSGAAYACRRATGQRPYSRGDGSR